MTEAERFVASQNGGSASMTEAERFVQSQSMAAGGASDSPPSSQAVTATPPTNRPVLTGIPAYDVAKTLTGWASKAANKGIQTFIDPAVSSLRAEQEQVGPGMGRLGARATETGYGVGRFFGSAPDFANRFVNPEEYGSTAGEQGKEAVAGLWQGIKQFPAQVGEGVRMSAEDLDAAYGDPTMKQPNITEGLYRGLGADSTYQQAVEAYRADPSAPINTALMVTGGIKGGLGAVRKAGKVVRGLREARTPVPEKPVYVHETNTDFNTFDLNKAGENTGDNWFGRGQYLQQKGTFKLEHYGSIKKEYALPPDAKIMDSENIIDYAKQKGIFPQRLQDKLSTYKTESDLPPGYSLVSHENGKYYVFGPDDRPVDNAPMDKGLALKVAYNKINGISEIGSVTPKDVFDAIGREKLRNELQKDGYQGFTNGGELVVYDPKILTPKFTEAQNVNPQNVLRPPSGIEQGQAVEQAQPVNMIDNAPVFGATEKSIGYNTHGRWASAKEIYDLEKERGNLESFDETDIAKIESLLTPENEAIWVTRKPEDAVRYLRDADEWDAGRPVTQEELNNIGEIDLRKARHIRELDDGDGGELWVRPRDNASAITPAPPENLAANPAEMARFTAEQPISPVASIQDIGTTNPSQTVYHGSPYDNITEFNTRRRDLEGAQRSIEASTAEPVLNQQFPPMGTAVAPEQSLVSEKVRPTSTVGTTETGTAIPTIKEFGDKIQSYRDQIAAAQTNFGVRRSPYSPKGGSSLTYEIFTGEGGSTIVGSFTARRNLTERGLRTLANRRMTELLKAYDQKLFNAESLSLAYDKFYGTKRPNPPEIPNVDKVNATRPPSGIEQGQAIEQAQPVTRPIGEATSANRVFQEQEAVAKPLGVKSGAFYEFFDENAKGASEITGKPIQKLRDGRITVGIPYHEAGKWEGKLSFSDKSAPVPPKVQAPPAAKQPDLVSKSAAPEVKPAAKQPWEMTRAEYNKWEGRQKSGARSGTALAGQGFSTNIGRAIDEGKPVPSDVVYDYLQENRITSDIVKRYPDVVTKVVSEGRSVPPSVLAKLGLKGKGKPETPPTVPPEVPPVEPKPVETKPQGYPDNIGSANRIQDEFRKTMNFDALPEPTKMGYVKAGETAEQLGMVDEAPRIAQDIVSSNRPHTAVEEAALRIGQAKAIDKARTLGTQIDEAIAKGTPESFAEADALTVQRDAVHAEISAISDGMRVGGSETGRALGQRNAMTSTYDPYSLENLVRKATVAKRGKLSTEEVAKYERIAIENERLQKQVQEISDREAQKIAELEKKLAERRVSVEVKKTEIVRRSRLAKETILVERNRIKKQLVDLGYRVNDITGVTAEGAYLAGRLALTYIKEGAVTLDEVVRKVLADMPTLTERDVWASINAKDPQAIAKARGTVEKRIAEIRTEARLLSEIDNTSRGIFGEKAPRTPANFVLLKRQLRDLRNQAYKSGADGLKKERIIQRTNELQAQIGGMYRNIKAKKPIPTEDVAAAQAKYNEVKRLMSATDETMNLKEQLRTGDFIVKPKRTAPVSPELERAQIELANLRRKARVELQNQKATTGGKVFREVTSGARTALAMGELSVTFRQTIGPVLSHPIVAAKHFGPTFKAFFNERVFDQLQNNIRNSENYLDYKRSDVQLNDMDHIPGATEEYFNGQVLEKIPYYGGWVRASNRHMTIFGNLIRTSLFDQFKLNHPNVTPTQMKAYGHFLNVFSGIGDLGKLAGAADYLSTIFFAPKLAASRFQTPYLFFKNIKDPILRKQIARDIGGFVATGTTVITLAKMMGAETSANPDDPNFGKIKIGDTHIDIWGGFQPPARLVARILQPAAAQVGLAPETRRVDDPVDLIGQFASYKFAPAITIMREVMTGKTPVGEDVSIPEVAARSVVPMFLQDIYDAYKQEGLGRAAVVAPLTIIGVGVNTYPDSEAATRQKLRAMKERGDPEGFKALKKQWNDANPTNKIESVETIAEIQKAAAKKAKRDAEILEKAKKSKPQSAAPIELPDLYGLEHLDSIPANLTVRVNVIHADTGKRVEVKRNARQTVKSLNEQLAAYKKVYKDVTGEEWA